MRFRGKNSISPLKKQHFLQKKTVFPYENTVFSSSIRRSNDELR